MPEERAVAPPGGDGMSVGYDPLSPPQIYIKRVVGIIDRNGYDNHTIVNPEDSTVGELRSGWLQGER